MELTSLVSSTVSPNAHFWKLVSRNPGSVGWMCVGTEGRQVGGDRCAGDFVLVTACGLWLASGGWSRLVGRRDSD